MIPVAGRTALPRATGGHMRRLAASALLSSLLLAAVPSAQSTVIPPPLSSDQEKRLSAMSPDEQIYERFRYWAGFQPPDVQDDALRYYDAYLASRGVRPTIVPVVFDSNELLSCFRAST